VTSREGRMFFGGAENFGADDVQDMINVLLTVLRGHFLISQPWLD